MPNFRRIYIPNSAVFITSVTKDRNPIFHNPQNIKLFHSTIETVKKMYPFELIAHVLLPDHFHWIIQVESEKITFTKIVQSVKKGFTLSYKLFHRVIQPFQIWQNRFWDHINRDEQDLKTHLDYIHWNPVKHRIAAAPECYPYSSFREYYERGEYSSEWGCKEIPETIRGYESE